MNYRDSSQMSEQESRELDRACQFFLYAAKSAVRDSEIDFGVHDKLRCCVLAGSTTATDKSNYHTEWDKKGYQAVTYEKVMRYRQENICNHVAFQYGLTGHSCLITNACAAGSYAIGQGYDLIRNGIADVVIAGGAESMSESAVCGFSSTRSLALDCCRPFDKNRDGLLVAEGAASLLLESYENATSRKARIYGEVIGYGLSCDGSHMTAPDVSGKSAAAAMQTAMDDAGIAAEDIDYVNAHGTGTPLNDKMETNGVKKAFGKHAYVTPISSIKSMIGHTFGASGAIEAVACMLALNRNQIPPTINYQEQDPDCDLYYVPNLAVEKELFVIMSNSFAFGGNNASLLFRKFI